MRRVRWMMLVAAASGSLCVPAQVRAFAPDPAAEPEERVQVFAGPVSGSYLGIGVVDVNADRAKALNLREEHGVEVTRVEEGSPAEKGGLKNSDVILEYNGQRIEGVEQLMRIVRETPPGREVKLAISRAGNMQNVVVTTGSRKAASFGGLRGGELPSFAFNMPEMRFPDMPRPNMTWRSSIVGIEGESLESQLATFFGVKEGVLVRSVMKDSAAEKAGIRAGDVITKVDDKAVTTPREITSALRSGGAKKSTTVTLVRDKREMTVNVVLERPAAELPRPPARSVSDR